MKANIPKSVKKFMNDITILCGEEHKEWAVNFNHSFSNTLETTLRVHDDRTTFLLTGDIPAMWLRDSTAQMRPYLVLAREDEEIRDLIAITKKTDSGEIEEVDASAMTKKERKALVKKLEKEMQQAASALDFEGAAQLRDMVLELRAMD